MIYNEILYNRSYKATKQFFDEELSEEPLTEEAKSAVGDDKVRILSTGFDLKTNFRH
jgi:hypothetical protein